MKKLFIQTVPVPYYGNLGFSPKEDYFAIVSNVAQECGFNSQIYSINALNIKDQNKKNQALNKDIQIRHFNSVFALFKELYASKPYVVFGNDRTASGFITSFFGKYRLFMSHQSQNPPIWWKKLIFKFFIKRFDAIKVANPYEKQQLISLGVKPEKIKVIPIPIDYEFFNKKPTQKRLDVLRKKYGLNKTDKVILFVANVRSQKNVYTILNAAKLLINKTKTVKFVFVGMDFLPDEKLPSIADKSKTLKLTENVVLTGRIPDDDVRTFMHLADVGVTSSSREGQCITVFEKSAAGLPLCLSDIGSFTSIFKKSALFHNPTDYETLAKNIETYIKDKRLVKKHTRLNKELVKERYNYDKIKKQLTNLFLSLD